MEVAAKALNLASRVINSNIFVDIVLVGSFVALSVRSVNQQNYIETLEAEKDSLLKSNKIMKKTMWDWKQQLFAEASSPDSAIVPLVRLKAIYGEAATVPPTDALDATDTNAENDGKSASSKLVI